MEQENLGTQNTVKKQKGKLREYIEAFLVAVLIAFFVRSFVIEAFKIPSGSMIPTLSIGDHIFVNKFIYSLRIPFTKYHIVKFGEPKRGDIIVFLYPMDEGKDFIKRVVGLPGDKIHVEGQGVQVNGKELPKEHLNAMSIPDDRRRLVVAQDDDKKSEIIPYVVGWRDFDFYKEKVGDVEHVVQYERFRDRPAMDFTVPQGHYFVMGDNRDNSDDSRGWGFVPAENVKGKAMFVWLSIDKDHGGVRWKEFGRWIR